MKEIAASEVIGVLRQDPYKYQVELAALEHNHPPVPRRVMGEQGGVLIWDQMPYGPYIWVLDGRQPFLDQALEWMAGQFTEVSLASPDPQVFQALGEVFQAEDVRSARTLVCLEKNSDFAADPIQRLTPDDGHRVEGFYQENPPRPTLQMLFEMMVIGEGGEVYVYCQEDEILGYLSASPLHPGAWDVDFIYVQPQARGRGIGTRLASYYAQTIIEKDETPYYSGVTLPASERAAQKAGFIQCRETFFTTIRRR